MMHDYYSLTEKQLRYQQEKHILDVILATAMLLVLALPMLVVCVLQKLSSPHEPIFFHQLRVGRGGKTIRITKFRSMKSNAPKYMATGELENGTLYISKLGRFLRDTSIDELPQLFQVVRGDMSLIGPRPLIPQEESVHQMRAAIGVYALRPGITGLAQVNGRDFVSDADKVKFDQIYLENLSLKMDVQILWMTVKKVLTRADIQEGKTPKRDG